MTSDAVVEILRHALLAAFWIAAPLMAIAFAAGVVISLAQIVTSIQDTAFSTIPRLVVFVAGPPAADALDDRTHARVHHGFVRRSGAVCPLTLWACPRCTGFCWCWRAFPGCSRWCRCPAFKAARVWRASSCR